MRPRRPLPEAPWTPARANAARSNFTFLFLIYCVPYRTEWLDAYRIRMVVFLRPCFIIKYRNVHVTQTFLFLFLASLCTEYNQRADLSLSTKANAYFFHLPADFLFFFFLFRRCVVVVGPKMEDIPVQLPKQGTEHHAEGGEGRGGGRGRGAGDRTSEESGQPLSLLLRNEKK